MKKCNETVNEGRWLGAKTSINMQKDKDVGRTREGMKEIREVGGKEGQSRKWKANWRERWQEDKAETKGPQQGLKQAVAEEQKYLHHTVDPPPASCFSFIISSGWKETDNVKVSF